MPSAFEPAALSTALLPLADTAYADAFEHIRDELWRAWLCVAYHIHRRWELGVLPRSPSDGNSGIWSAQNLASLMGVAEAQHGGAERQGGAGVAGPDTA